MWWGGLWACSLLFLSWCGLFPGPAVTVLFWVFLISFALFSTQFKQSSLFTLPIDLFSKKDAASVWGISGSAGSFGAMLFTPIIRWLVDTISYSPVFVIVALMHVFSAIFVMVFIPNIRHLQ